MSIKRNGETLPQRENNWQLIASFTEHRYRFGKSVALSDFRDQLIVREVGMISKSELQQRLADYQERLAKDTDLRSRLAWKARIDATEAKLYELEMKEQLAKRLQAENAEVVS